MHEREAPPILRSLMLHRVEKDHDGTEALPFDQRVFIDVVGRLEVEASLEEEVQALRAELSQLGARVPRTPRLVVLREIAEEQAAKEIEEYLQRHEKVLTSDLVTELGIDIDMVLRILEKLAGEGKIESQEYVP